MKSALDSILTLIGLKFDPDRDGIRCPYKGQKQSAQTGQAKPKAKEPDNLVYDIAGGRGRLLNIAPDGHTLDWELYDPDTADRTATFTDYDKQVIEERREDPDRPNLKEESYRTLKPIYADGLSAAKASKDSRNLNGPGYKIRTLENYFAAMNQAVSLQMIESGKLKAAPPPAAKTA